LALVAVMTAVAAMACSDIFGGASRSPIASISALALPYPTVVVGDVMRDSLGQAAPVSIQAYDANGNVVTSQLPTFTVLDATTSTLATSVQIDQNGFVHGLIRDTLGARVFAGFGTLTAPPQRVIVSVAPAKATRPVDTLQISFIDSVTDTLRTSNWSGLLELMLTDASGTGAQGFVVTYAVTRYPAPLNPGDQAAYIADATGKPSGRDTTKSKGTAGRRVVLRQSKLDTASVRRGLKIDTITVRATVKYNGADVSGTPIDYIIPVSKKP
jgi:hypothetical protein